MKTMNNEQTCAYFKRLKNEVNKMRRRLRAAWATQLLTNASKKVWSAITQLLGNCRKHHETISKIKIGDKVLEHNSEIAKH